jgi:hypothetical protein
VVVSKKVEFFGEAMEHVVGLTIRRRRDGWRRWGYGEILKKYVEKKKEKRKEGAAVTMNWVKEEVKKNLGFGII